MTSLLKQGARPRGPRARLRLRRRHRSRCDRGCGKTFPRLPRRRRAMATWTGSPPIRNAAPIRACCGPDVRSVIMLGVNYGPDENPLAISRAAHPRRDLGLCAGRRLSRPDQEAAEGAGAMAGRRIGRRGQGVRRYRRRDGKAAGAGGGTGLAGQAHQPRLARIRLMAVSRRDLHDAGSAARRGRRPIIAARARPASISARPRRFPRPTSSMRGAAFPISPSRTRARSRANSAKPSATASMAATIASRSARGTSSRRPAAKPSSPRATNCARPIWPIWRGSTMPRFARCLRNRRSSASAATASSATC